MTFAFAFQNLDIRNIHKLTMESRNIEAERHVHSGHLPSVDSSDGGRPIHISAEVGSSPNYSYIFDFEREFDSVEVKQVGLILI